MRKTFNDENYHAICDKLALADADLAAVLQAYGYPPVWKRANNFESLVHIILEQQVSLASALAALNKLKQYVIEVSPANIIRLTDEQFNACYFSRQKMKYTRILANAILDGDIDLARFEDWDDEAVRHRLIQLKGIGNWTIDIYLMFVLRRSDIFPAGDLAAVKALRDLKHLAPVATREEVLSMSDPWKPYRTIATMILWHYYLSAPRKRVS